jgi:glutathione reductase (NADPH)
MSYDFDLFILGAGPAGLAAAKQATQYGVKVAIAVDKQSRTTQPHIYAVGDCTNRKQLTPVAKAEGQAAVNTMFGKSASSLDRSQPTGSLQCGID